MKLVVALAVWAVLCNAASINVPVPQNTALKEITYNWPTAKLPYTPGIQPQWNVQLESDAENIVDLTFGTSAPGATVKSVAELGNVVYFYDIFGDPNSPRSAPVSGIPGNFQGVYSFYPEFLANGSRNPLAVHRRSSLIQVRVLSDRLRLVGRTNMTGSQPKGRYEVGYIRLPFEFVPGMTAELQLSPGGWPNCKYSWPTFWMFSGVQLQDKPGNLSRWYPTVSLENDGFDGYPTDNSSHIGSSIPNGCPLYKDQSFYNYPDDIFMQSTHWGFESNGGGGPGVNRLDVPSEYNPTDPNNPGLTVVVDWSDVSTIKYIYNGELVRIRHVNNTGVIGSNYDGTPPPASRMGSSGPMVIMVSHQFGVNFNPKDLATLNATTDPYGNTQIIANYDIQSLRIWNKPTTTTPTTSTPSVSLPAPITGSALGDLPQISSGTYVLNFEVVGGVPMDHFGNKVRLFGDAAVESTGLKSLGKQTVITQYNGLVSITGPAVSYAQNGGNFMLFMATSNRAPYGQTSNNIYAQFSRQYPMTDVFYNKPSLFATPARSIGCQVESSTDSSISTAIWPGTIADNQWRIYSMNHTLGVDGTVILGVGVGSQYYVQQLGAGVPASQLDGYTELTLGAGRNRYNKLSQGANLYIAQAVMVAFPPGQTLSASDLNSINTYLANKYKITGVSNTTENNIVAYPLQLNNINPPSKSSFTQLNTAKATISDATDSLSMSQPSSTINNTAMLLTAFGASKTFTALIQPTMPFVYGLPYVTAPSAGIVLRDSASGNVITLGVTLQTEQSAAFRANYYHPGAAFNGSYGSDVREWWAQEGRSFWVRVIIDGSNNIILLSSVTGRVNEWTQIFSISQATYGTLPNQIGFYVNSLGLATTTGDTTLSVYHMDPIVSGIATQNASSAFTSTVHIVPVSGTTVGHATTGTTAAATTASTSTKSTTTSTSSQSTTTKSTTTTSYSTATTSASTGNPTIAPTKAPTQSPTKVPTQAPTTIPTQAPTNLPTFPPVNTPAPSSASTTSQAEASESNLQSVASSVVGSALGIFLGALILL